jgi:hypothetical protein
VTTFTVTHTYSSEEKCDSSLIDAGRITICIAGNSTERPNEDMGNRLERLPKRLGGLSLAL